MPKSGPNQTLHLPREPSAAGAATTTSVHPPPPPVLACCPPFPNSQLDLIKFVKGAK